jgi:enterochelin esterase-like enzyme
VRPPRIPKYPPPEVVASPRIAALEQALAGGDRTAPAAFWAEVARTGTPLVEPRDDEPAHRTVTFLWRDRHGDGAGTRRVVLLANKLTDPSVWDASTLHRLPGTDVWHRSFRLRADWRATYQLAPDDGPQSAGDEAAVAGPPSRWGAASARAIADPHNARAFPSRYGSAPHSIVELPDAPPQPWVAPRPGVPRGTLSAHRLTSSILGNERDVWLYVPAARPAPADVLVLLDGEDWATRLPAATILDNLIDAGRIPPTVAVMASTVDNATRWRELACHPPFLDFLADELLPWAAERHPISPDPARTTLAGRSLGGLTALFAALERPGRFGRVLSQSASLWWPSETEFDAGAGQLVDAFAAVGGPPADGGSATRFHLEVGLQEWALLARHRHLRDVLAAQGRDVSYVEYHGGHDALCWQGGLADGLIALAGPPVLR